MDLRYRLAAVVGAGSGVGREVAVALSRVGAAVLVVDRDLAAAETTAALVRAARVRAWALQADVGEDAERRLVAARGRDLGGLDLLVSTACGEAAADSLAEAFLADLTGRRGRRDGTPAVVHVGRGAVRPVPGEARVMAVSGPDEAADLAVSRVVVDLLSHGADGQVVEVTGPCPG